MVSPLVAMPPPEMLMIWPLGFGLVLVCVGLFVSGGKSRERKVQKNRGVILGLTAILCGPMLGVCLAWLLTTFGEIHPADIGYTFTVYTVIGSVAGFVVGVTFAIAGLFGS